MRIENMISQVKFSNDIFNSFSSLILHEMYSNKKGEFAIWYWGLKG